MTDTFEDMRKAKEEAYFKKQNEAALKKIAEQQSKPEEVEPPKQVSKLRGLLSKLKNAVFPE